MPDELEVEIRKVTDVDHQLRDGVVALLSVFFIGILVGYALF